MSLLAAVVGSFGELPSVTVSSPWQNLHVIYPAFDDTNSDRTVTWTGGTGTRTISIDRSYLSYRINSGTWIGYVTPFTINSGDTVGWKLEASGINYSLTATVKDDIKNTVVDTFTVEESNNL